MFRACLGGELSCSLRSSPVLYISLSLSVRSLTIPISEQLRERKPSARNIGRINL